MYCSVTRFEVDELNKEWQKKCDSLLNDAHVRHQMALAELEKRSEQLEETVKATEQKVNIVCVCVCMYVCACVCVCERL